MLDPRAAFDSPDQFLYAFDGADAVFIEMDRDAYHRSIFTDKRVSPRSSNIQRLPWAALLAELDRRTVPPRPLCFIFHIAHCGSTLLARALDVKDANLVCREPPVLRQLGVEAAGAGMQGLTESWRQRLSLALALLARRYNADGPVIIKANVPVNFIIDALVAGPPDQPAIFLHYPLEQYLLAILRSPTHRAWVEYVSRELQGGLDGLVGASALDLSVPICAARLWLAQMLLYDAALAKFPNAVSLSAEIFFSTPKPVIGASFKQFGQTVAEDDIETIVGGDLFRRYSKDPAFAFNNDQRLERENHLKRALAGELHQARTWVENSSASRALPTRLDKPLLGDGVDLL